MTDHDARVKRRPAKHITNTLNRRGTTRGATGGRR